MDYHNPELPEGVNVSETHPLREFLVLLGAALVLVVVAVSLLAAGAGRLVRFIPFSYEQCLAAPYEQVFPAAEEPASARERYVRALAGRVSAAADLPAGMQVRVHYLDSAAVNAFATLGGNIVIHRGLVEAMPSENALAMVIAHEIAHVRERHPIVAMGRGLTVMAALASVAGLGNADLLGRVLGKAGLLTMLSFNRRQEREADTIALQTLHRLYGHVAGAEGLFETLDTAAGRRQPPALLSTHPLTTERIDRVRAFAATLGTAGPVTPLPAFEAAP